jgi:hypothetical protein
MPEHFAAQTNMHKEKQTDHARRHKNQKSLTSPNNISILDLVVNTKQTINLLKLHKKIKKGNEFCFTFILCVFS